MLQLSWNIYASILLDWNIRLLSLHWPPQASRNWHTVYIYSRGIVYHSCNHCHTVARPHIYVSLTFSLLPIGPLLRLENYINFILGVWWETYWIVYMTLFPAVSYIHAGAQFSVRPCHILSSHQSRPKPIYGVVIFSELRRFRAKLPA